MWRLAITGLLAASAAAQATCNGGSNIGSACTSDVDCPGGVCVGLPSLSPSPTPTPSPTESMCFGNCTGLLPVCPAPTSSSTGACTVLDNFTCNIPGCMASCDACNPACISVAYPCPLPPTPTPTPVTCGNGVLDSGETCDDGNTVDGDGCSATCTCETPSATVTHFASSPCDTNGTVNITLFAVANAPWVDLTSIGEHYPVLSHVLTNAIGDNQTLTIVLAVPLINGVPSAGDFLGTLVAVNTQSCTVAYPQTFNSTLDCTALCGNGIVESPEQCDSTDPCCVNCMYAVEGTACDDSTVCNGNEACDAVGVCQPGTPLVCDDNNQCTTDTCDSLLGCLNTPVTDGTACDDGLFCTDPDTCVSGVCTTPARDCSDSINCTVDACDETNNVCLHNATDSLCPSTSCQTGHCSATDGCYTVYNPAGNCVVSKGYWKNHYTDFQSTVNITYDNYICYTPSAVAKNVRDPLYWFNQPVRGSTWLPLADQYYAAVANYNSQITDHCCLPGKCTLQDYFGDVYDCFVFARTALKTAFPVPISPNIPLCTTSPKFASSVNLTRATQCQNTLDDFNKGQGSTVPYCNDYEVVLDTTTTTTLSSDEEWTRDEEIDLATAILVGVAALALLAILTLMYMVACGPNKAKFIGAMMGKMDYTTPEPTKPIRGRGHFVML